MIISPKQTRIDGRQIFVRLESLNIGTSQNKIIRKSKPETEEIFTVHDFLQSG